MFMIKTQTKLKPYKEVVEKVLFSTDYYTQSSNGDKYPTNRVKIEHITYSWQTEIKWEIRDYEGEKIVLRNTKLTFNQYQWQVETKKKLVWQYIKDDETLVKYSIDEMKDLLKYFWENPL